MCTETIHRNMADNGLRPYQHFVDAAYMSADLLVRSADRGIELIGPQRINSRWQSRVEGAYTADQFVIDWPNRVVTCPQGAKSTGWGDHVHPDGKPYHKASFPITACRECQARSLCTRSKQGARRLLLHPQQQQEALQAARQRLTTDAGWTLYARRAGIEGTLSQAVRICGLRRTRYRGLLKTHLQHVAIAAAVNIDRIAAWLTGRPHAATRTSSFAALVN